MTVYLVTGRVAYRKHPPGAVFETDLDPDQERRAVAGGFVRIIDRRPTAGLQPGSWTLPAGWAPPPRPTIDQTTTRAPHGAFRI